MSFHHRVSTFVVVSILVLATALTVVAQTQVTADHRGRYAVRLPEGAHTLEISAPGHTTAWRQVIVPAGGAVIPIDVRLDERGERREARDGEDLVLTHGGDTAVTAPATLTIPAGTLTPGTSVTLTSVGQQSLAGLLPHGWSPLASAEIRIEDATVAAAAQSVEARGERREASEGEARGERREASEGEARGERRETRKAEGAKRVVSLSRLDRLEVGDATGQSDVRNDRRVSQGRTVRVDATDSTISRLDSVEHRGGERARHDEGFSSASVDRPWIARRTGTPAFAGERSELSHRRISSSHHGADGRAQQNTPRPSEISPLEAEVTPLLLASRLSPLASSASLTFVVPHDAIIAANQTLTAVVYNPDRDEWIVLTPVVNITSDGTATIDLTSSLASRLSPLPIALVYPDKAANLATPETPTAGAPLRGVTPLTDVATVLESSTVDLTLDPAVILPTGRTVATLSVDSPLASHLSPLASGTAIQAWIDEELHLADGTVITDPPFATDLILYRSLDGAMLQAQFHLAPTERASEVILEVGYENIRIRPYPYELPRGEIIGPEGGRVPGGGEVVVEIPAGATTEPIRATSRTLDATEIAGLGAIPGFRIAGGFELQMQRLDGSGLEARDSGLEEDAPAPVELWGSARVVFPVADGNAASQIILARIVDATPYGRLFELASRATLLEPRASSPEPRFSTALEDPTTGLPDLGITTEGRYLILVAEQPIAWAWGTIKSASGRLLADAQVLSLDSRLSSLASLGVTSVTPATGLFAIPVVSDPAPPFLLAQRHHATGDGAPYTHPTAPAKDEIVPITGGLTLTPQPPTVSSTTPANGATEVSLTTSVRVAFTPGIDPTSVTQDSLIITNTLTGERAAGTITADSGSITWTLPSSLEPLAPTTRYSVAVSPTVRGPNGAPLGTAHTFSFTTLAELISTETDPSKIRITIPDDLGRSTVIGLPGALPSGWQALAVRRGAAFRTQYQSTAAADGSFQFTIGDCTSPLAARRSPPTCDAVAITNAIDLRVINTAGNLAAILPLTPFTTEDQRGFIAPVGVETTYTTPENITITVPAGAFDQATLVTATKVAEDRFNDVASFSEELRFGSAVELGFDCQIGREPSVITRPCRARQRLQIEAPAPPETDPSRPWLLGMKARSTRGQRVMIVDTVRVENGRFTTAGAVSAAGKATIRVNSAATAAPGESQSVKQILFGAKEQSVYTFVDINVPEGQTLTWAVTNVQKALDLYWSQLKSLFLSALYVSQAEHGTVAFPVIANQPFIVTGVDTSNGLVSFKKLYDAGVPPSDPGVGFVVDTPDVDKEGPYPVFGTPFRIEILDLEVQGVPMTVGAYEAVLQNGLVKVTLPGGSPIPADVRATLLNVSTGASDSDPSPELQVSASAFDRVVLLLEEQRVDPGTSISVVFSEPIYLGDDGSESAIDQFLRERMELWIETDGAALEISDQVRFVADSDSRRVRIEGLNQLRRGASYVLRVGTQIRDRSAFGQPGLRIGERKNESGQVEGGLSAPLDLRFKVREPGGVLGTLDLANGSIREMALHGNLLLLTALDGGLFVFDAADPGSLTPQSKPIAHGVVLGNAWGLAVDQHSRVWGTALGSTFGSIIGWDLNDFLTGTSGTTLEVTKPSSSALISWAPGASASLQGSLTVAGMPEAIPRKIFVVTQDEEPVAVSAEAFQSGGWGSQTDLGAGWIGLTASIPYTEDFPYPTQRVTVENSTRSGRWSGDATAGEPAVIEGIVARPGDTIRIIRNLRTWGVVTLFGYGIGVYDLNAIASNDSGIALPAGADRPREQLVVTTAGTDATCAGGSLPPGSIGSLAFSPDAVATAVADQLRLYGLEVRQGVLDFQLSDDFDNCIVRGLGFVLDDEPRLAELRSDFEALANHAPRRRLSDSDTLSWRIEEKDNLPVVPGSIVGQRGSLAKSQASREYVLVAAADYGLLIFQADGTNTLIGGGPQLDQGDKLVDIIWSPAGVWAVRAIPERDMAVIVDGEGHVLLVDLSRIDERYDSKGEYAEGALFETAKKSLSAPGAYGVGLPDTRILWRSDKPLVTGTLAPVFDPDTGMLYAGELNGTETDALSIIDPQLRILVDLGDGLGDLGEVLPLGVPLPDAIDGAVAAALSGGSQIASASAFRVELTLPGGAAESLPGSKLALSIESERVPGVIAEQTREPLPRAHLRTSAANGGSELRPAVVAMQREVPAGMEAALRHQKLFNRFMSDWIVPLADPRASVSWNWPNNTTAKQKSDAGCANCDRPPHLKGLTEGQGIFEIMTSGWSLRMRPSKTTEEPTPYDWLFADGRLDRRVPTTPVDTVRAPEVQVAAQDPPVATGLYQEMYYVHSGEMETAAIDLDAGGRTGWNVLVDRTYRSRVLGASTFGDGWDSSLFRRLRPLPNGDVEYRDGRGELWTFRGVKLTPPEGLLLKLARTDDGGFKLTDVALRESVFDSYGRLIRESDEFYNPVKPGSGNTIHYLYGTNGRVARVVDPLNRTTEIDYEDGRVIKIRDWRQREVLYKYDGLGRLENVQLPEVPNTSGASPVVSYGYYTIDSSLKDRLELSDNLLSILDPGESLPRVTLGYGDAAANRDRVTSESWATGEKATFQWSSSVEVTDVLKQKREFVVKPATPGTFSRAHITSVKELAVPILAASAGALPESVDPAAPALTATDRERVYSHAGGFLLSSTLAGVRTTTVGRKEVLDIPGAVVESIETTPVSTSAAKGVSTKSSSNIPALIKQTFNYQQCEDGCETFLAGITITGEQQPFALSSPIPHRYQEHPVAQNDSITRKTEYDLAGRPTTVVSEGGIAEAGAGSEVAIDYHPSSGPLHSRGRVKSINRGGLITTFEYPDANTIIETDPRSIQTRTRFDDWDRPVEIETLNGQPQRHETLAYDAAGRLATHTRKQGALTVETTWGYDEVGRVLSTRTDNVEVDGALTTVETKYDYNLAAGTITTKYPSGAVETRTIDPLGRTTSVSTTTGEDPILTKFAWDIDDNLVYQSDGLVASVSAFDPYGREIVRKNPDNTIDRFDWTANGQARAVRNFTADDVLVGQTTLDYSGSGRVESIERTLDTEGSSRTTQFAWDGAGRTAGVDVAGRTSHTLFDTAGRLQKSDYGAGSATTGVTDPLSSRTVTTHHGWLPNHVVTTEKSAPPVLESREWNAIGQPVRHAVGNLEQRWDWDEAGNVISAQPPARPPVSFSRDARGALLAQNLPDGSTIQYQHDSSGSRKGYIDQVNEVTHTVTDLVGRPLLREYSDGTSEVFTYSGPRLGSYIDRQGRSRSLGYDDAGRVATVTSNGLVIESFSYGADGRLARWATRDGAILYPEYDLDGRPLKTVQERYKDGSGTSNNPVILDRYEQTHSWNTHGERSGWTMPTYAGFAPATPWTAYVTESHDVAGNVISISRTLTDGASGPLLSAGYRNAERPTERTVTTAAGATIQRSYGYDESNGLLNHFAVSSNGSTVAGAALGYDGVQIADEHLLGVSGESRYNIYDYDARSRLSNVLMARPADAVPMDEVLDPADFREALVRPQQSPADPPSIDFTEQTGHKIATVVKGNESFPFEWNGSERLSDGRFNYRFDERGHLVEVREIVTPSSTTIRRVLYIYGPQRLLGRRAEFAQLPSAGTAPAETDWQLETRNHILQSDGLPAETTFAWDAVTDTIAAIWRAGASENPSIDANGGLLRQVIHGGLSYDDPIEVTVAHSGAAPLRLYPIYSEAGGGQLQAVLNEAGEMVSRASSNGAYGEDAFALPGPAVDRITLAATTDDSGTVSSVTITARLTEAIDAATLDGGARLAMVDGDGAVLTQTTETPDLADPWTLRWNLTAGQWTELVGPAETSHSLSIAVTSSLRATAWGTTPVLLAPDWAIATQSVHASPELPVEYRHSVPALTTWLDALGVDASDEDILYEVDGLGALAPPIGGDDPSRVIVAAPFHAHPWQEPLTGINYLRARWYDPGTGAFLSPDPLGYQDSSNLYAFAGGDPVNGRDPTGTHDQRTIAINGLEVRVDAPTMEEMAEGNFMLGVSYIPPGRDEVVHHLFESSQGADLFLLARLGVPFAEEVFEQFYGVQASAVDYSGPRAWWQSFRANSPNIAFATLGSIVAMAPPKPVTSVARIRVNLAQPRPQLPIEQVPGAVQNGQRVHGIPPGSTGGATANQRVAASDRARFFEKAPPLCSYCRFRPAQQVDHVKARSLGGNRAPENMTPACDHCNPSKGARIAPKTPPKGFIGDWPPAWWPEWMRTWWKATYGG